MDNRVLSSLQNKIIAQDLKNTGKFVIDERASLNEDSCYETSGDKQNNNANDYMLSNFASCECEVLDSVLKTSTDNNGVIIKDGYGISNCNVDEDSGLRVGTVERRFKSDLQLFPRPYLTLNRQLEEANLILNLESRLLNAQQNKKHSQTDCY